MTLTKYCFAIFLSLFFLGYGQFLYYAKTHYIEWGPDASDALFMFHGDDLSDIRLLLVSESDLGDKMLLSFINMHPALLSRKNFAFIVLSPTSRALNKMVYLDYYAFLHLKILYIKDNMWRPTLPPQ